MNFSLEQGFFALVWTKQILFMMMSDGYVLDGQNVTFLQQNQKQIKKVDKYILSA